MRQAARVLTVLLLSCGGQLDNGPGVGGETHFLVTCGDDCGAGLSCIEGVCTRSCEPGFSSCSELASAAQCVGDFSSGQPFAGTCDVRCAADAECSALGRGFACRAGACRAEPEARLTELSSTGSVRQPLVRAVDTDTCLTGLRWVGGNRGSAEMHPGSDCMSCHGENDARPFLLAGTVYAAEDEAQPYSTQPLDGCYGLEGILVTVTDQDGREQTVVTNRAGNFYIEASPSVPAWPYDARINYPNSDLSTRMFTQPYHGGCARCHYTPAAAPDIDFRLQQGDPESPGYVVPAGTVILAFPRAVR